MGMLSISSKTRARFEHSLRRPAFTPPSLPISRAARPTLQLESPADVQAFLSTECNRGPQRLPWARQVAHGDDQEIAGDHVLHPRVEGRPEGLQRRPAGLGVGHVEDQQSVRPAIGRQRVWDPREPTGD